MQYALRAERKLRKSWERTDGAKIDQLLTYPDGPVKVLHAEAGLLELVDVGDPLEAVAGDEHRHDDEADLAELDLLGPLVHRALSHTLRYLFFLQFS